MKHLVRGMLPTGVPWRILTVVSSSVLKHKVDSPLHVLKLDRRKNVLKSPWVNNSLLATGS